MILKNPGGLAGTTAGITGLTADIGSAIITKDIGELAPEIVGTAVKNKARVIGIGKDTATRIGEGANLLIDEYKRED